MSTLIATNGNITNVNTGTIKDATGNTTAMTIDSTGRILTPARPAFHVERNSSDQSITSSQFTVVQFENEVFDIGGNFDMSNHRFTAPIAGIYHFSCTIRCKATNATMDYVSFHLYKNGSKLKDLVQFNSGTNNMDNSHLGGSTTVQLAASDYIELKGRISGGSPAFGANSNGNYTHFSGFLVG